MDPLAFLNLGPAGVEPQDPAAIIAAVAAARAVRQAGATPAAHAQQPEPVAAVPAVPTPKLIDEIPPQFDSEGRRCGPRGVVLMLEVKLLRAREAGRLDEVRQLEHWLGRARLRLRAWCEENGQPVDLFGRRDERRPRPAQTRNRNTP